MGCPRRRVATGSLRRRRCICRQRFWRTSRRAACTRGTAWTPMPGRWSARSSRTGRWRSGTLRSWWRTAPGKSSLRRCKIVAWSRGSRSSPRPCGPRPGSPRRAPSRGSRSSWPTRARLTVRHGAPLRTRPPLRAPRRWSEGWTAAFWRRRAAPHPAAATGGRPWPRGWRLPRSRRASRCRSRRRRRLPPLRPVPATPACPASLTARSSRPWGPSRSGSGRCSRP
mmetsp:Transcript_130817/g.406791  ORF Transcript_130817/g.406791 Transcript_130817/m.406791 type:complete len:225 (-) Transcript_130817:277-951(-)